MKGSLIIKFNDGGVNRGDTRYSVTVTPTGQTGQIRDLHFSDADDLYSTYLELNDTVTISLQNDTGTPLDRIFDVERWDYTTDEEDGDRGIKITQIFNATGGTDQGVTFVVEKLPNAYDYEYRINTGFDVIGCIDIGTGFTESVLETVVAPDGNIFFGGDFTAYNGYGVTGITKVNYTGEVDLEFYNNSLGGFGGVAPAQVYQNAMKIYRINNISTNYKIVCGGFFSTYAGQPAGSIVRLNLDGTIDTSFVTGSGFTLGGNQAFIFCVHVQLDGKVLVGGLFDNYNGIAVGTKLCRLNVDGSYDFTFGTNLGSGFNDVPLDIKQVGGATGVIYVGGEFTTFNGGTANRIVSLNSTGTKNTTFNYGTGFNDSVRAIELTGTNLMVGGDFTTYNGVGANRAIRILPSGVRNTLFSYGTGFDNTVSDIRVLSNSMYFGGTFTTYKGVLNYGILKTDLSGNTISVFNTGAGFNGDVTSIYADNNNPSIYVGGDFTEYDGFVANGFAKIKYFNGELYTCNAEPSGNPCVQGSYLFYNIQSSYSYPGTGTTVYDIAGNKNATLYGTPTFNNITPKYIEFDGSENERLEVSGTTPGHTSFSTNMWVNFPTSGTSQYFSVINIKGSYYFLTKNADGRISLGTTNGSVTSSSIYSNNIWYNIVATYEVISVYEIIIKLYIDGVLVGSKIVSTTLGFDINNNNFNLKVGEGIEMDYVFPTKRWSNVKLGVAQLYLSNLTLTDSIELYNCKAVLYGRPLKPLPNPLPCFNNVQYSWLNYLNPLMTAGLVDSNNKIVIGGRFNAYNEVTSNCIGRLDINGYSDLTFNTSGGTNNFNANPPTEQIVKILEQSDGKYIVLGQFSSYAGVNRQGIVRINTNGSIDSTYGGISGFTGGYTFDADIQSDGKVIVVGDFIGYSGTSKNRIVRLNTDGTIDNTFTTGTGFTRRIFNVKVQPDGKILCFGFSNNNYNGTGFNNIIRLNSNGSVDTSFTSPQLFTSMQVGYLLSDGKIMIGTDADNTRKIYKLNSNGSFDTSFIGQFTSNVGGGIVGFYELPTGQIMVSSTETQYNGNTINSVIRIESDGTFDSTFRPVYNGIVLHYNQVDDYFLIMKGIVNIYLLDYLLYRVDWYGNLENC